MNKVKQYIDSDVLTEARKRINDIIDTHDRVFVAFSGGKDSLVCLELVDQIYKERGIKEKVRVIFRDEEFIPPVVLDFVNEVMVSGRFDFKYYCIQLRGHKYILGKKTDIIQWDSNRKHMRPIPEYAITSENVLDQYTSDQFTTGNYPGKCCIITGIRTDESLNRLNAVKNKKNRPWVAAVQGVGNVFVGRPIYDWSEKDVFKFFYDNNIKYNAIYDHQVFNESILRVSSTINTEMCKHYENFRKLYPVYFDQVCELFPELLTQMRYWKSYDKDHVVNNYSHDWSGVFDYIRSNLKGSQRRIAEQRVIQCMNTRNNKKSDKNPLGGYPVLYVFKQIIDGNYKRAIMPVMKASKKQLEYEGVILE